MLSAIIWPVALFAAVGASFLLYYAITDIVKMMLLVKLVAKQLIYLNEILKNLSALICFDCLPYL